VAYDSTRELCPNDGTQLFYATDWLGRLAALCPTCSGRYWTSQVPREAVIPPEMQPEDTDTQRARLNAIDLAVEAIVEREPRGLTLEAITEASGYTRQRVKMSLARLRGAGVIGDVRRRSGGARASRFYYHTSHAAPPCDHTLAEHCERILAVLERHGDWLRGQDMAKRLGTRVTQLTRPLGILLRQRDVVRKRMTVGASKNSYYRLAKKGDY
jgi:predicted ArsR family transcriptional regulator